VGRSKQISVGGRADALAACYHERVLVELREAHPEVIFIDARGARPAAPSHERAGASRRGSAAGAPSAVEARKRSDPRRWVAATLQRIARGELDVAVMDARWIPLQLPPTVEIAAILERTNPFDVLVSFDSLILDEQPENTCIAASEPVKRGQILYYRPDLKLVDGSDDFDELSAMMKRGEIAGFIYPASDTEALNQQENVVEVFTTSICTPLAGQGALALLSRRDRKDVVSALAELNDPSTAAEVELERAFLELVTKDGRGPVGVLGNVEGGEFEIEAAIAEPDGSEKIVGEIHGHLVDRARLLGKLAGEILQSGGGEIIASFRKTRGNG
jgi:hydroxymethylbilane synthase